MKDGISQQRTLAGPTRRSGVKQKTKNLVAVIVAIMAMQVQIPLVNAHGVRTSGLLQVDPRWSMIVIGDCQVDVLKINRTFAEKKVYLLPAGQSCGLQVYTTPKRRNLAVSLQYLIGGKWQVVAKDSTGPNGWVNLFHVPTLKDGSVRRGIVVYRIVLPNSKVQPPNGRIQFG